MITEDFSDIAARLKQIEQKETVYGSIQEAVDAAMADEFGRVISVRRLDKACITTVQVQSWKPVAPMHQGSGDGFTVCFAKVWEK